jgi:hypothetical protein
MEWTLIPARPLPLTWTIVAPLRLMPMAEVMPMAMRVWAMPLPLLLPRRRAANRTVRRAKAKGGRAAVAAVAEAEVGVACKLSHSMDWK